MKRTYILQIEYDPETEEVEWLQEEITEEVGDSSIIENEPPKIEDPFDYLLDQMTEEDLLSLTTFELGIA